MTPDLTDLDRRIYDYARDMITECGEAPSLGEISERFDLRSRTMARMSIDNLVGAGWLVRTEARERNLDLAGTSGIDLTRVATGALQAELSRRDRPFRTPRPVPTRFTRPCAAEGCRERVTRGHWACLDHWLLLPAQLRDELLITNRTRQTANFAAAWDRAVLIWEKARG